MYICKKICSKLSFLKYYLYIIILTESLALSGISINRSKITLNNIQTNLEVKGPSVFGIVLSGRKIDAQYNG